MLVNVTVKDKSGNFVRNLKPEDFTILEDNKPQKVTSFDIENVDAAASQDVAQSKPLTEEPAGEGKADVEPSAAANSSNQFKDRRLIILFFDLSAMEPDEMDRATTSALRYVDTANGSAGSGFHRFSR